VSAYAEFLANKSPRAAASGLSVVPPLNAALKPFQAAITSWALRRGRAAVFAGTGLGKTLMQLEWARVVAEEFGNVLILCPLAVAEQTVAEAQKFGIEGVAYAADQAAVTTDIVVTNYERFEKFDIDRFAGIVLDESGIIKSHDGKTRKLLTESCATVPWKLCCSATPAPNDYTELGQHSEFLGVMDAKEMLAMFFVHDGSIRAVDATQGHDGWRMKRHAAADFWRWLASWSVMVRHPADLGFDEPGYDLPPLNLHQVTVAAEYKPTAGELFPMMASTLSQRIGVRRDTADDRVERAVEIILREPDEPWLVWCNLNKEADAIEHKLPNGLQVAGKDKVETKVERLLGFNAGEPLMLVSKPAIAGHGMNYQHCARMVMVGLTDSFEQVYQAIRRCWRFGQTRPVEVYFIASELEGAVVANLKRKEQAFDLMLDAMSVHMRDLQRENVLGGRNASEIIAPRKPMEIPTWMTAA
jgi:superfamily II DNA or RNA helicase